MAKKRGGLAVAGALLVTLLVAARVVHLPVAGALEATTTTTLAIDERVGVVVDAGAALTYARDWRGALALSLTRGRAFVRLSTGALVLTTPHARVRVGRGALTVDVGGDRTELLVHEGEHAIAAAATGSPEGEPARARDRAVIDGSGAIEIARAP